MAAGPRGAVEGHVAREGVFELEFGVDVGGQECVDMVVARRVRGQLERGDSPREERHDVWMVLEDRARAVAIVGELLVEEPGQWACCSVGAGSSRVSSRGHGWLYRCMVVQQ